ncbi:Transcription-repair coupling factor [Lachnospiraceae bacterium TWA4]|nr:Transcription-repair coupling factor [Lachnospiraceae bacterium TWA4]
MKTEEAYRIKTTIHSVLEELKEGTFAGEIDSYLPYFCKEKVTIFDYLPENTCVIIDEPLRLQEKLYAVILEFEESMKNRLEKGYILPRQMNLLGTEGELLHQISQFKYLLLGGLEHKEHWIETDTTHLLLSRNVPSYSEHIDELLNDLKSMVRKNYRIFMVTPSRTKGERLAKELEMTYGLRASFSQDTDRENQPGRILIIHGNLAKGFEYPEFRTIIITDNDLFGQKKHKKRKKHSSDGSPIRSFDDVSVGDYVIHENHGLGIYQGTTQIEVDGTIKDYLKIEYANSGNLYVPVTQLDLVQKYTMAEGTKKPKLNSLGGKEWTQTKKKVKTSVQTIAKELVELYAARQNQKGFAFSEDNIWQREFEELFPYEETDDQLMAIESTKKDMESTKIMDRLVCGDVGFGKTEIAIRAAFKAVQDSKQVVYLVPTTILAQQHYNTFASRMAEYPIRVELLSRFKTAKQIKNTIEDLKKGLVDIVIGTHRVLSKDVGFKNLGLLIIDEEQRFGVKHKEQIKHLKENVDVLTLTATPIPRTLHMSLIGIRDMSVLEEAPLDRLPVQTYVMEHDEELIREAIKRELARSGQVYYVNNRVQNIEDVTAKLRAMLPDAVIEFAHGKMSERTLEKIMLAFINGEIDVLVSTTIIETGLDIPNVNTIIIQDADKFGLSQLYQLRGRVGRSTRTSYAFLTYTRGKILREVAEKRLSAIRQFTELGSGVKIAMQDLEIRGAGNILGADQHGHMEAIGYDLYCKMLNQAVKTLKNPGRTEDFDTLITMDIDAYIPDSYITDGNQKIDMYKKIASIENEKDFMDMQDELIDRYGDLPLSVQYLLRVSYLKAQAHDGYVTEVVGKSNKIVLTMHEKAPIVFDRQKEFISFYRGRVRIESGKALKFVYEPEKNKVLSSEKLFDITTELLAKIKEYLVTVHTSAKI